MFHTIPEHADPPSAPHLAGSGLHAPGTEAAERRAKGALGRGRASAGERCGGPQTRKTPHKCRQSERSEETDRGRPPPNMIFSSSFLQQRESRPKAQTQETRMKRQKALPDPRVANARNEPALRSGVREVTRGFEQKSPRKQGRNVRGHGRFRLRSGCSRTPEKRSERSEHALTQHAKTGERGSPQTRTRRALRRRETPHKTRAKRPPAPPGGDPKRPQMRPRDAGEAGAGGGGGAAGAGEKPACSAAGTLGHGFLPIFGLQPERKNGGSTLWRGHDPRIQEESSTSI